MCSATLAFGGLMSSEISVWPRASSRSAQAWPMPDDGAGDDVGAFGGHGIGPCKNWIIFGITLPRGATQLDCRRASDVIFAEPANIEKWKHRPATKEQRDKIKFVEGKVPAGITHHDAEKRIET